MDTRLETPLQVLTVAIGSDADILGKSVVTASGDLEEVCLHPRRWSCWPSWDASAMSLLKRGNHGEGRQWSNISETFVGHCGPLPTSSKGNCYILVATDLFTKWVEAFPLRSMESTVLATVLVDEIVCCYGVLMVIHSD